MTPESEGIVWNVKRVNVFGINLFKVVFTRKSIKIIFFYFLKIIFDISALK
jgi:hypothetical protein